MDNDYIFRETIPTDAATLNVVDDQMSAIRKLTGTSKIGNKHTNPRDFEGALIINKGRLYQLMNIDAAEYYTYEEDGHKYKAYATVIDGKRFGLKPIVL